MASWFDVLERLEAGLYEDDRLAVAAVYRGEGLPKWMETALGTVLRNAHERCGVLVINCRGRQPADALCILRLADLEELTGHAGVLAGSSAAELAILAPDRLSPSWYNEGTTKSIAQPTKGGTQ